MIRLSTSTPVLLVLVVAFVTFVALLPLAMTKTVPIEAGSKSSSSPSSSARSLPPKSFRSGLGDGLGSHHTNAHAHTINKAKVKEKEKVEMLSLDSEDRMHHSYGSQLPAFTHDYGELVMSAMIERGSSPPMPLQPPSPYTQPAEDLHLTMFLMGHRVLVDNFPFESLSTDEHILLEWCVFFDSSTNSHKYAHNWC